MGYWIGFGGEQHFPTRCAVESPAHCADLGRSVTCPLHRSGRFWWCCGTRLLCMSTTWSFPSLRLLPAPYQRVNFEVRLNLDWILILFWSSNTLSSSPVPACNLGSSLPEGDKGFFKWCLKAIMIVMLCCKLVIGLLYYLIIFLFNASLLLSKNHVILESSVSTISLFPSNAGEYYQNPHISFNVYLSIVHCSNIDKAVWLQPTRTQYSTYHWHTVCICLCPTWGPNSGMPSTDLREGHCSTHCPRLSFPGAGLQSRLGCTWFMVAVLLGESIESQVNLQAHPDAEGQMLNTVELGSPPGKKLNDVLPYWLTLQNCSYRNETMNLHALLDDSHLCDRRSGKRDTRRCAWGTRVILCRGVLWDIYSRLGKARLLHIDFGFFPVYF